MVRQLGVLVGTLFVLAGLVCAISWSRWEIASAPQPPERESVDVGSATLAGEADVAKRRVDDGSDAQPPRSKAVTVPTARAERATDVEWDSLERTNFSIPARFRGPSERIAANDLFRHRTLNPGDTYIPEEERESFRANLGVYVARLKAAEQLEGRTATAEFGALKANGRTRPRSLKELNDSMPAAHRRTLESLQARVQEIRDAERAALGLAVKPADPTSPTTIVPGLHFDCVPYVWDLENGVLHRAELAQLPETARVIELRRCIVTEMAGFVVQWFELLAGMTEGDELLTQIHRN